MANTQVAEKKERTIYDIIQSNGFKSQMKMALPKHVTAERLTRIAVTAIRTNPALQRCTADSLLAGIMLSAQLGLEPNGSLGQAYLIPYGKDATFIIGYKGLIELARRSGDVSSIRAEVVYENDVLDIDLGLEEKLVFKPAEGERGAMKSVFGIAKFKDGGHHIEYMTEADVEQVKKSSKSANGASSPWKSHTAEMWKKTVIRRMAKYLPMSIEKLQMAVVADEATERGENVFFDDKDGGVLTTIDQETGEIIEDVAEPTDNSEQAQVSKSNEQLDAFSSGDDFPGDK